MEKIDFSTTFVDTPVVVLSPQACSDDTAFQLCVRNVNRNGFEVRVRYEGRLHNQSTAHSISYIAATSGATDICGKGLLLVQLQMMQSEAILLVHTRLL